MSRCTGPCPTGGVSRGFTAPAEPGEVCFGVGTLDEGAEMAGRRGGEPSGLSSRLAARQFGNPSAGCGTPVGRADRPRMPRPARPRHPARPSRRSSGPCAPAWPWPSRRLLPAARPRRHLGRYRHSVHHSRGLDRHPRATLPLGRPALAHPTRRQRHPDLARAFGTRPATRHGGTGPRPRQPSAPAPVAVPQQSGSGGRSARWPPDASAVIARPCHPFPRKGLSTSMNMRAGKRNLAKWLDRVVCTAVHSAG